MLEVQPHVEGRVWRDGHFEAEALETLKDVVALVLEMQLQGDLLGVDVRGVEQRNGSQLERVICTAVEERAGLRQGGDDILGTNDPADTEAWQTPVLFQH